MPKAGSSFIQDLLYTNRSILFERNNIFVPKFFGKYQHRWFPFLVGIEDKKWAIKQGYALDDGQKRSTYENKLKEFERNIRGEGKNKTWVISTEFLTSVTIDENAIKLVADFIESYFEDIKVCIYIREQSASYVSGLSQIIKGGHSAEKYMKRGPLPENMFNYQKMIGPWVKYFGKSRIDLRLFCKSYFKGGTLFNDFCNVIDVKNGENLVKTHQSNLALSSEGMRMLNEVNKTIKAFDFEQNTFDRNRRKMVTDIFERQFAEFPSFVLSQQDVDEFRDLFAKSNEWIKKEFFPERKCLWEKQVFPDEGECNKFELNSTERALIRCFIDLYQKTLADRP